MFGGVAVIGKLRTLWMFYSTPKTFKSRKKIRKIQEKGMASHVKMVRKKSREELIDSAYNRYAHNDDQSILPKWFVEDELRHHRPNLPVTAHCRRPIANIG